MPNETRWKATWTTLNGMPREFFFYSETSQVIARVDFLLKLIDQGQRPPDDYELEEARIGLAPRETFNRERKSYE